MILGDKDKMIEATKKIIEIKDNTNIPALRFEIDCMQLHE